MCLQDVFDTDCVQALHQPFWVSVAASSSSPDQGVQHMQNIPSEEWDRFCHLLEYWCDVKEQDRT